MTAPYKRTSPNITNRFSTTKRSTAHGHFPFKIRLLLAIPSLKFFCSSIQAKNTIMAGTEKTVRRTLPTTNAILVPAV